MKYNNIIQAIVTSVGVFAIKRESDVEWQIANEETVQTLLCLNYSASFAVDLW